MQITKEGNIIMFSITDGYRVCDLSIGFWGFRVYCGVREKYFVDLDYMKEGTGISWDKYSLFKVRALTLKFQQSDIILIQGIYSDII